MFWKKKDFLQHLENIHQESIIRIIINCHYFDQNCLKLTGRRHKLNVPLLLIKEELVVSYWWKNVHLIVNTGKLPPGRLPRNSVK